MNKILIFIIYSILILVLVNIIAYGYLKIRRSQKPPKTFINSINKIESIEYSDRILKFTRELIADYVVNKFKEYIDNTDMTKIAKPNLQKFTSEITIAIYEKLNLNNILFQYTLFTKEYFEEFIINYTMNLIKQLISNYYNTH